MNKKKVIIGTVVVVLLVVIVALGIIIFKLLHQEEEPVQRLPSEGLIVDNEEEELINPTFTTDMNMIWSFPAGKRTSNDAVIGNSEENEYDIYFEVYLEDEQETLLYTSPVLPVGKRLDKLKLDKALPSGEYAAICTFHLLDKENPDKEVSNVSFNVTLIFY